MTSPWVLTSPSGPDETLGPGGLHCAPGPLDQLGSVPPGAPPGPAAPGGKEGGPEPACLRREERAAGTVAALEGGAAVPEALGRSYCPQVSPETKPSPLGRAVETEARGAGQSCSLSALHASARLPGRTPRCPRLPRVLTPQHAPDPTRATPGAQMRLKAVRREPSGQAGTRHGFCLQQPLPQPAVRVPRKGSPCPPVSEEPARL